MNYLKASQHITAWLNDYCESARLSGFIIGISGGIDSALTSTLCAATGKKTILVNMPIRQSTSEYVRASNHIADLKKRFSNVESFEIITKLFIFIILLKVMKINFLIVIHGIFGL